MWRSLSRALDAIYRLAGVVAGILLVTMCLLVLYSILARLFGLYAGGATDFAGYVMATSTFMALSYAFRSNGHIRVALVVQRFSGPSRRGLEIAALAVLSVITGFLAYYMSRLAMDSYEFGERSEGADAVLLWIPQTPVALGAILFAIAVWHSLLQALFDYDAVNPEKVMEEGPGEA